jgi:hypothetical protein
MGLEGIYKGRTEPVLVVLDRGQQACIAAQKYLMSSIGL